jgi:hypothetical protein
MNAIAARALAFFVGLSLTAEGAGQTKTPFEVYKAYLEAFNKATSLDAILPYYTQEFRGLLEKQPAPERAAYFKNNIAKENLTDIKVTQERTEGSKAVLEMTAKTGDGRTTTGSATLLKEGGEWKIDEDAWATPPRSDSKL